MKEISGRKLQKVLGKKDLHIIDVRPVDAFNGWTLNGEKRGGHIPGARSLPARWVEYVDWIEIVRNKNILPEDTVVIYGYAPDLEIVASRFEKSCYENIFIYPDFINEWTSDDSFSIGTLPRYKNLVYAEWINKLIYGKNPPQYDNDKYVVVQAHYRNRDAYLSGHIPGAIDIDTLALESPKTWKRRSPDELKEALESHGITFDTTVILYGKFMFPDISDPFPGSAAGDLAAMRCAFIMMHAGVKDIRILNGGYQSWQDAGLHIAFDDVPKTIVKEFGTTIPAIPSLAVDTPEAKRILNSTGSDLVCVRSWKEYIGEESGYNYIEKKGRIPGAIFADGGSDAYHMENYRNADQTTREYREIADFWKKSGIIPDKHLAFYCGTGWRASEAFINAWLMGFPKISVYDGGWFEWSNDPSNPVETGIPQMAEAHSII
jgi:molybdopterin synthase sulfurtransferase